MYTYSGVHVNARCANNNGDTSGAIFVDEGTTPTHV